MAHVGDGDLPIGDTDRQGAHLVVRALEEVLDQPKLTKELERRWMHRVSSKIAKEVRMLLEHLDAAPGAREQQGRHHARRTTAGDHEIEL